MIILNLHRIYFLKIKTKAMKIKNFLIALITVLVLTLSAGSFSFFSNDASATVTTSLSKQDGDLEYVRVFVNGEWWIYVYDGGELIAEYPDED